MEHQARYVLPKVVILFPIKDKISHLMSLTSVFYVSFGTPRPRWSCDPITSANKRWLCPHAPEPAGLYAAPLSSQRFQHLLNTPLINILSKVCCENPHTLSLRFIKYCSMPPGLTLVIFWSIWTCYVLLTKGWKYISISNRSSGQGKRKTSASARGIKEIQKGVLILHVWWRCGELTTFILPSSTKAWKTLLIELDLWDAVGYSCSPQRSVQLAILILK